MTDDEGMPPPGLSRALGLVADRVGEPDLAPAAWVRGQQVRRRRQATVGAVAAGALVAVAVGWSVLGTGPDERGVEPASSTSAGPTRTSTALPTWTSRAERPRPPDLAWVQQMQARGDEVRGTLRRACPAGVDRADCEHDLGLDPPAGGVDEAGHGVVDARTRADLSTVFGVYLGAAGCLEAAGLPSSSTTDGETFIQGYAAAGTPTWHPFVAAAEAGRLAEALQACPVEDTWSQR